MTGADFMWWGPDGTLHLAWVVGEGYVIHHKVPGDGHLVSAECPCGPVVDELDGRGEVWVHRGEPAGAVAG